MKKLPNLKNVKQLPKLENLGVIVEFDPQEDDLNPYDMFDEGEADKVAQRHDNGFLEAWFCAKVTVKYRGMEESDYLGGCSYGSFKEFTGEYKGYYLDMINTCINAINKEIEAANQDTIKAWDIRKAKNILSPYGLYIVSSNTLQTI